jgi:hypothetical protein
VFLRRRFPTPIAVIHAAECFSKWVDYHVLWLAECILHSSFIGLTTEWNFGAVIGMCKIDFIQQVNGVQSGIELFKYLDNLNGRLFQYHALDMGMSPCISVIQNLPLHHVEVVWLIWPWFTHAGVLQGPTQIAAALYPIEHSLAGPMDVVMSSGVDRMEEDFETVRQLNNSLDS